MECTREAHYVLLYFYCLFNLIILSNYSWETSLFVCLLLVSWSIKLPIKNRHNTVYTIIMTRNNRYLYFSILAHK